MAIAPPRERDVQKSILDYLAALGAFRVRINSGAVRANYRGRERLIRFNDAAGCPDVLCCVGGRFVGIEVKRPGGKPTVLQVSALDAIRKAGGIAFVADGIGAVERALKAEGLL